MTKNLSQEDVKTLVLSSEKVQKNIDNKTIIKEIYVKDKLYNLVVK